MTFLEPYVSPANKTRKRKVNETVDTAISIIELGTKAYNFAKEWRRRKFAYSVTISEADHLYQDVHDWLLSVFPHEKHRSLTVSSVRRSRSYDSVEPESVPGKMEKVDPLQVRFNDKRARILEIGPHRVEVVLVEPDTSEKSSKFFERMRKSKLEKLTSKMQKLARKLQKKHHKSIKKENK